MWHLMKVGLFTNTWAVGIVPGYYLFPPTSVPDIRHVFLPTPDIITSL